jgi:hypothetical protein
MVWLCIVAKPKEILNLKLFYIVEDCSDMATLVSSASSILEQMKYEIAAEFGIELGPETTSRENGSVGGEMTKRLVALAESGIPRSGASIVAPPAGFYQPGGIKNRIL